MRKTIYLACLLLLVALVSSCSVIGGFINDSKEKIGSEYTVFEGNEIDTSDSHGAVENYESSLDENIWTTKFDYMNSTGSQFFIIEPDDKLVINSTVSSGEIWTKITQGNLAESEIQKVQVKNDQEVTMDLSQWKNGEIAVWLVVKQGEDGLIKIEHIKN